MQRCEEAARRGRGFAMRTQDPTIRLSFQVTEWRVRARCATLQLMQKLAWRTLCRWPMEDGCSTFHFMLEPR